MAGAGAGLAAGKAAVPGPDLAGESGERGGRVNVPGCSRI